MANKDLEVIPAGKARSEVQLTIKDELILLNCDFTKIEDDMMCGVVFKLPLKLDTRHLLSFAKIDSLLIDAVVSVTQSTNVNSDNHRARLFIKNLLNEKSWPEYTNSDVKYHAVRFEANGRQTIPLANFKVETWWEEMYGIPYEAAQKDLSKISSIELFFNEIPVKEPGVYQLKITQFEAKGHYLQLTALYIYLAYFWPFAIAIFVAHNAFIKGHQVKLLTQQAHFDTGTKLLNQQGLFNIYPEYQGRKATFYVIQISNWLTIIKHFNLDIATQVLMIAHQRLRTCLLNQEYVIARISNDELLILKFGERLDVNNEQCLLLRLQDSTLIPDAGDLRFEVKIGVVQEVELTASPSQAINNAREAINAIRHAQTKIQVYNGEVDERARYSTFIESQIRKALDEKQFYLLFMPLYNSRKNRIVGAEALLRCNLPSLKSLSPEVYISIAEKSSLIREIDFWVLQESLGYLSNSALLNDSFVLSINLSARELLDISFSQHLKKLLVKNAIPAHQICLEITETCFVDLEYVNHDAIQQLRNLGCRISLDDFGTGYTSFNHLVTLPVDEIKIDRSFTNNVQDKKSATIIDSIIAIAKVYGYEIIAEGIETQEQLTALNNKGCDLHQGYFISKPTSLEQVLAIDNALLTGSLVLNKTATTIVAG